MCVSVCHRSCGRNFESKLLKLCAVVWGRKTKTEFNGGQNPIMPSPILAQFSQIIINFQRDGPNTAVSTPVDRLWWLISYTTLLGGRYGLQCRKWHNPQCSPKTPQNCVESIYNRNMLSKISNISAYSCIYIIWSRDR